MKTEGKHTPIDIFSALFADLEQDVQMTDEYGVSHVMTNRINGKNYINSLTPETIKQNIFVINRRLAINYPIQAQLFNSSSVNPVDELKFWSEYLYNGKYVPKWAFTKGVAKSKEKKKKSYTHKDIVAYANKYNISTKDLEFAMRLFPEETEAEIMDYKKYLESIKSN